MSDNFHSLLVLYYYFTYICRQLITFNFYLFNENLKFHKENFKSNVSHGYVVNVAVGLFASHGI